jgi:hypothetical protein
VEQELLTLLEHLRSPPVTQLVTLMEQELLTLLEHLRSPPDFSGVRVAQSLVFCVVFCILLFVLLPFFILTIALFVLL